MSAPERGGSSLWEDGLAEECPPRDPLDGDVDVDVAIVGAGLTGIWTAWYLLRAAPGTRVVLVEREVAGFGASGRNGGWCSALFPASPGALVAAHGVAAAQAMRRAMLATVDEVGRDVAEAGVDADYRRVGTVLWARSAAQERSARAEVRAAAAVAVDRIEWRPGAGRGVRDARGHAFVPDCASVHPGRLVRGMARAVERVGARILERTRALEVRPRGADGRESIRTDRGVVRAERVVVATEGYTGSLPGWERRILPLHSLMIATEPLPGGFWDEIGIAPGQTFSDWRHLLVYGQRTADDRIAFGGRGARVRLGPVRAEHDVVPRVFAHLERALVELLPGVAGARITHRWGGPLGVARDWHGAVRLDRRSGIGFAGGYVGDGLSTTNLAGRTLTDLLLGRTTELTALPWVGHRSPDWEPEPLRFLGANAGLAAMALADVEERLTRRRSLVARAMGPLTGR